MSVKRTLLALFVVGLGTISLTTGVLVNEIQDIRSDVSCVSLCITVGSCEYVVYMDSSTTCQLHDDSVVLEDVYAGTGSLYMKLSSESGVGRSSGLYQMM